MNSNPMTKLSYGLFLITAADSQKDNGCIINTAIQVTENPQKISIAINKSAYTHSLIEASGRFNISVLSISAPFSLFERFGFASGRDSDKFDGFEHIARSKNSLLYLTKYANAVFSLKVCEAVDLGTHTLFIADVTESFVLSDEKSATYEYYFSSIKPKKEKTSEKKGYVCTICGFVYEGEDLPEDYVCPLCNHGAEFFEKL